MRVFLVVASLLLTTLVGLAAAPTASAAGECIGKPGQVAVCQNLTNPTALYHCVSVGVGLQGASVCSGPEGDLRVCAGFNCITVP